MQKQLDLLALVIYMTQTVEQELFLKHNINPDLVPWDRSEPRIDELECDTESMEIAVTLAEWFKYETKRGYATWGGLADETPTPKADGLQQRIIDLLEHKSGAVTLREIQRKCKVDKSEVVTATEHLIKKGLVERIEPKKLNCGLSFRLCSTTIGWSQSNTD